MKRRTFLKLASLPALGATPTLAAINPPAINPPPLPIPRLSVVPVKGIRVVERYQILFDHVEALYSVLTTSGQGRWLSLLAGDPGNDEYACRYLKALLHRHGEDFDICPPPANGEPCRYIAV